MSPNIPNMANVTADKLQTARDDTVFFAASV